MFVRYHRDTVCSIPSRKQFRVFRRFNNLLSDWISFLIRKGGAIVHDAKLIMEVAGRVAGPAI